MCKVTIKLDPASDYLKPYMIETIQSVFADETTAWGVNVLFDETTGDWNVGAQPGDDQPFHGTLPAGRHSVDEVKQLVSTFLEQYKEWTLDEEN